MQIYQVQFECGIFIGDSETSETDYVFSGALPFVPTVDTILRFGSDIKKDVEAQLAMGVGHVEYDINESRFYVYAGIHAEDVAGVEKVQNAFRSLRWEEVN